MPTVPTLLLRAALRTMNNDPVTEMAEGEGERGVHVRRRAGRTDDVHWIRLLIGVGGDGTLHAECAQQPWQSKHVVTVQVRNENEVHVAEL